MSISDKLILPPMVTIHPWSQESIGDGLVTGNSSLNGAASATWQTADRAIYVPFTISSPSLIKKMFVYNGATASGNIDIGIYDRSFTKLVSSGEVAQAGINALQEFDIADTLLGPGLFYMALVFDTTTGTVFRVAPIGGVLTSLGCAMQTSASPLPAIATPSQIQAFMPVFGLSTRGVV
jgi:hypothetical protein